MRRAQQLARRLRELRQQFALRKMTPAAMREAVREHQVNGTLPADPALRSFVELLDAFDKGTSAIHKAADDPSGPEREAAAIGRYEQALDDFNLHMRGQRP